MGEFLVFLLNTLSGNGPKDGLEGGHVSDLQSSLSDYNSSIWGMVEMVHNVAVKPISAGVLAVMFALMLAKTAATVEGDSQLGVRIVAMTGFKIAMVFVAVSNALPILNAIWSISTDITKSVITNPAVPSRLGDAMKDKINAMPVMDQIAGIAVVFLPFILAAIALVVPFVVIFVRFMQASIMAAFASLPLSFMGHEDTKPIAIGYLKNFGATALSGAVIVLVLKLVGANSFSGFKQFNGEVLPFLVGNFWNMCLGPVVLLVGLITGHGMAKKILGEG